MGILVQKVGGKMSKHLLQQQMIADANSKREEAYARAPELKPKPKPGRPKKSAIK